VSAVEEGLVKVWIEVLDDPQTSGESFWAMPVGPELYELRNSPWYAHDLHFGDVVRAVAGNPGEKLHILKVVRPSGHKTLRVIFPKGTPEETQVAYFSQLKPLGASYERAYAHFVAIDVLPEGDYQRVCDLLSAWEQEGVLEYDTGAT
jgi:hypothetical protein